MLNREELVALYRKHRGERVLSLYLNAEEHDPAKRRAWRRALDQAIDDARARIEPGERGAFDTALAHLKLELKRHDAFLPDAGWVGFAQPGGLLHADSLPIVMPNLARWEDGIRVAPYVRALKRAEPVITVLADSRQVRLYRQVNGEFAELPEIRADMFFGDLTDVNMSKRATTHTGVRGMTDTDSAQRFEGVGTERMLKALIEQLRDLVNRNGTIVVGGPDEVSAHVLARLPRPLQSRAIEERSMSFHDSLSELKRASAEAAQVIAARHQARLLDEVFDLAHSGGRGCLGPEQTSESLRDRRVEVLLLSRRFTGEHPEFSDFYVGSAFEQGAEVEELGGEAGERIDRDRHALGSGVKAVTRHMLAIEEREGLHRIQVIFDI